jgi:hypothetical protein
MLNPRTAWADRAKYDQTAQTLAKLLKENFKRFASAVEPIIADALNPALQQLPPAKGNVPANTPPASTGNASSGNAPSAPTQGAATPSANAPNTDAPSADAPSTDAPSASQSAQRQMRVPQPPPKGRGRPNIQTPQQQNDANAPNDEAIDNELSESIPVALFGRSDSPENEPEFRPTLDSALDAAFEGDEDGENDGNDGEHDGDAQQDGQNQENAQFRGGRRRGGRGRGGRGRRR